ncbi:MAG TPA: 4-(cytidine 5'-diphospho)-2-C-methyl-D-erythritol kinase, partial [Candidatus Kapabacteria bacterium]|nr:4-(cytidine 5'-diphospho)-2-C-methyl-D-erythritol kinase [Candidatus Kapabacteria bacterium]
MKTLTKNANAKINIGLQVLNKRSDNYHNINSIFIPISLCDIITISESIQFELRSNVQFNITDDENLVMKAAKKFNEALGINKAYSIKLQKEIPMQAGLGGGSADAAVVLKMLNEMNGNPFGDEYLAKLAIELGSDVPFFIFNKPAIAKGRGEILEFINFRREINVLVVFPNVNISTKEAYEALKRKQ